MWKMGKTILTSLSFPDTKFFLPAPCGLVKNRVWTRSLVKLGCSYASISA